MAPAMPVLAGAGSGGEGRLSWPVFLLTLAAVTSSSISALSLYQLLALRAEVEGLKSDVCRRREEGQAETVSSSRRSIPEPLHQPGSQQAFTPSRRRRTVSGTEALVSQPFLQLLANNSRKNYRKEVSEELFTGIPWQPGLRRGEALQADGDRILVRQEGYYFVYSQVFYIDPYFTMGHVVIRWKRNVVGDEPSNVFLFRCIQSMNASTPFNSCYTGGIAKLDAGDYLELLIPRPVANVSLEGDSTFLGAVKLA